MSAPGLAVAAAAGFAGLALLAVMVASSGRARGRLVLLLSTGAAVGGSVAAMAAPTGIDVLDAMWRVSAAVAVVALAAAASPMGCLIAAAAGAGVGLGSEVEWLAAAGLGAGLAIVLSAPQERGSLTPVIGAALGPLLLRLDTSAGAAAGAGLALVPLVPLAVSALFRAPNVQRQATARAAALVGSLLVLIVAGWGTAAIGARASLLGGVESTTSALAAARAGERPRAAAEFAAAAEAFAEGRRDLSSWWAQPVLALPVAGRNARALARMTALGERLAATAAATVLEADPESVRLASGRLPLDRVRKLEAPLERSLNVLEQSASALRSMRSPLLVAPLSGRLKTFAADVDRARRDARVALSAVRAVPTFLGGEQPRRYFLAIQTPSELRGTGGLMGNFGEVVADGGHLTLTRIGRSIDLNQGSDPATRQIDGPPEYLARYSQFRPAREWRNVNMAPDFPTVAGVIAGLYPQSGGQPIDGVIAVDPVGLAALLRLTGPVNVPGLPVPLTEANAAEELLFSQYIRFEGPADARVEFLGTATAKIWEQLTNTVLPGPAQVGAALAPAVRGKHLLLHSIHEEEQRFFELAGVAGEMPGPGGDSLAVINQNAGGNKLDWFLHRALRYDVSVDPVTGDLRSTVHVRLENRAPLSGAELPSIVVDNLRGGARGHNYTYLSVLSPWLLESAEVDGRPLPVESEREDDVRYAYSAYVSVPPGEAVEVTFHLRGILADPRHYTLNVWRQPTVHSDRVELNVALPRGWKAAAASGLRAGRGPGQVRTNLVLDEDVFVGVEARRGR